MDSFAPLRLATNRRQPGRARRQNAEIACGWEVSTFVIGVASPCLVAAIPSLSFFGSFGPA